VNWQPIQTAPLNIEVETKIDDVDGERNVQSLVQKQRNTSSRPMWWFPDGSMYVYYTPTHWRPLA
jgi:hypothetical protein